jgi:hypothetical protein
MKMKSIIDLYDDKENIKREENSLPSNAKMGWTFPYTQSPYIYYNEEVSLLLSLREFLSLLVKFRVTNNALAIPGIPIRT